MVPVAGHWVTRLTSLDLLLWSPEGRIIILDSSASVIVRDRRAGPLFFHRREALAALQLRWMRGCEMQHRIELDRILRAVTLESWKAVIDIHDQEIIRLAERVRVLTIREAMLGVRNVLKSGIGCYFSCPIGDRFVMLLLGAAVPGLLMGYCL